MTPGKWAFVIIILLTIVLLAIVFEVPDDMYESVDGSPAQVEQTPPTQTPTQTPTPPTNAWTITTDGQYMTNEIRCQGGFNNMVVEGADLCGDVIIDRELNIYVKIYEYCGDVPIKSNHHSTFLLVVVTDGGNGQRYEFSMDHYLDKLEVLFKPEEVHNILLHSKSVLFAMCDIKFPTTQYGLVIDCTGYSTTYKQFTSRWSGK